MPPRKNDAAVSPPPAVPPDAEAAAPSTPPTAPAPVPDTLITTSSPAQSGTAASPSAAALADKDKERRESRGNDTLTIEDLNLPRSIITRLAKGVLPPNTQIQGNAITAMSKSATVFINHLANAANTITINAGKKTIMPGDVFAALDDVEFGFMKPQLEAEFARFSHIQTSKRSDYRRRVAAAKKATVEGAGAGTDADASFATTATHDNDADDTGTGTAATDNKDDAKTSARGAAGKAVQASLLDSSGGDAPPQAKKAKRKHQSQGSKASNSAEGSVAEDEEEDAVIDDEEDAQEKEDAEGEDDDEDEEDDEQDEDEQDEDALEEREDMSDEDEAMDSDGSE